MTADRPATGPEPLTGWEQANAVMPGAWRVESVTDLFIAPPNNFVATAVSIGRLRAGTAKGHGDSPASALDNLTRKLREKRDGASDE